MPNRVVFEIASLADAISKAERIAPSKGDAFDKAAGIVLDVFPSDNVVLVRSTNLQVYYREWIKPVEMEGDDTIWRLPSRILASYISSLTPSAPGKTVTFTQDGSALHIQPGSGKGRAKFLLIQTNYYPDWDSFDTENMVAVESLGTRVSHVEWAADKRNPELGLHFTESHIMATDKYRLARAELAVPGMRPEGITISPGLLGGVIKNEGITRLKADDIFLMMMPDDSTQVHAVIMGTQYPPIERAMVHDHDEQVTFRKSDLIERINRCMKIIDADRTPLMMMIIGKEEIAVMMSEDERGHIGEVLEVHNQALHDRVKVHFQPKNVLDAISAAPNEEVTLGYWTTNTRRNIYINGGSGYEAWVSPTHNPAPTED